MSNHDHDRHDDDGFGAAIGHCVHKKHAAEDDGWIEWKGGKRPVGSGVLVDVRLRNGLILTDCKAGSLEWGEYGCAATIAAYRVHGRPVMEKRPGPVIKFPVLSPEMERDLAILRGEAKGALSMTGKSGHGANLPTGAAERKALPVCTGVLDYFPDALAAVAEVSRIGNDQHNPGQPLHWSKGKSTDHADCALRHFMERGTRDTDGGRHTAKAAWRVLAYLQTEIEAERGGMSFEDYVAKLNREWK